MNNIFILTKTYFKSFIGSLSQKGKNPSFYVGILMCCALSLVITLSFTFNSISTTQLFLQMAKEGVLHAERMAMYTNCTMAILMLLFVTVMRSVIPSKSSDNDALLSLPFSKMQITVSKGVYNYVIDFALFASILLPSYVVYYLMVPGTSFYVITRGCFLLLFLPMLSNALATFIGTFVSKIATKIKRYSIFQTIVTIILIAFYLIANYSIQGYLNRIVGTVEEITNKIFIIKVLLEFILFGRIGWFSIFIIIIIGIYFLSFVIIKNKLGKLEKRNAEINKKVYYKSNSILRNLINKELKQYFSIPMYLLNTIFPGVIYFGLCVAVCVLGKDKAFMFLNALPDSFKVNADVLPIMILSIMMGSLVITGCSISLEGKTFWILLSHPIKPMQIFLSKILTNLIISGSICIISYPFILTFIEMEYAWIYLIVPFASSVMSSTLGLLINLKFPKMEWDREDVVIKQSLSAMLSLFLPVFLVMSPYLLYITNLYKYYNIHSFMVLNLFYLTIITLGVFLWLKRRGDKVMSEILNN